MRIQIDEHEDEAESPFWITYSDLLSSLLMVFLALLFAFQALTVIQAEQLRKQKEELERRQAELRINKENVESRERELKKDREKLNQFVQDIEKFIKQVDKKKWMSVSKDGEVTIETNSAWFNSGRAELLPNAKSYLSEIIPGYVDVVTNNTYKGYIRRILIEGHADLYGPGLNGWEQIYRHNLSLSLNRGLSVSTAVLDIVQSRKSDKLERLRNMLTVGGRSNIQLRIARFEEKVPTKSSFAENQPKYRCVKLRLEWRNPSLDLKS